MLHCHTEIYQYPAHQIAVPNAHVYDARLQRGGANTWHTYLPHPQFSQVNCCKWGELSSSNREKHHQIVNERFKDNSQQEDKTRSSQVSRLHVRSYSEKREHTKSLSTVWCQVTQTLHKIIARLVSCVCAYINACSTEIYISVLIYLIMQCFKLLFFKWTKKSTVYLWKYVPESIQQVCHL